MLKRREFLEQMAAMGVGAAAAGSGLTLLDPTKQAYASREHSGETLTVITQSGPPIASAVQASMAPFKKLTCERSGSFRDASPPTVSPAG